jgi:hypothetical protein
MTLTKSARKNSTVGGRRASLLVIAGSRLCPILTQTDIVGGGEALWSAWLDESKGFYFLKFFKKI